MKSVFLLAIAFILSSGSFTGSTAQDSREDVFGSACGWAAFTPKMRMDFYRKLNDDNDHNATVISRWLNSHQPEKQLYAIEAVYCIEHETDYEFKDEVHETINQLEKSDVLANTCRGCIYDKEEMQEVIKRIKKKKNRTCNASGPSF